MFIIAQEDKLSYLQRELQTHCPKLLLHSQMPTEKVIMLRFVQVNAEGARSLDVLFVLNFNRLLAASLQKQLKSIFRPRDKYFDFGGYYSLLHTGKGNQKTDKK